MNSAFDVMTHIMSLKVIYGIFLTQLRASFNLCQPIFLYKHKKNNIIMKKNRKRVRDFEKDFL